MEPFGCQFNADVTRITRIDPCSRQCTGMLRPVYHGENGLRTLRELARTYQTISKDLARVMSRVKHCIAAGERNDDCSPASADTISARVIVDGIQN